MKTMAKFLGLFLLTSAFVATGCSGGGTESESTVDLIDKTTELTLSGQVIDDPIVNAGVSFMVGSKEFSGNVPTGSRGEFQLRIESDNPDALVIGNAFDAANAVRLSAVLDTFQGHRNRASNNVVNNVNITNVTTAQQVLAERLAFDGRIDSYQEFLDLMPLIDAMELLELSASIKSVVENINGSVLPSQFVDTLELARAIADGSSTFDADIELSNPGTLAAAQNKLLSDGNATLRFNTSAATGVYVAAGGLYIYAVFENGSALVEYFDDSAMANTPSWNLTEDGKIDINFFGFDRDSDQLTLLSAASNAHHIVADSFANDGGLLNRSAATVTKYGFGSAFDATTVPGTFADPSAPQNSLVFQAGGAGYSMSANAESTFSWSVNSKGHLMLDYSGSNKSVEIIKLSSAGSANTVLSITRSNGQWPNLATGSW